MIVIGEKINGTRKDVAEAIENRSTEVIVHLARDQAIAGADYIDVNAGTHPDREPEDMAWLVETIQQYTQTPLCLDSANSIALKAGLKVARKRPMLNSLSGEKHRIEGLMPLIREYNTELVILAVDDDGIPNSAAKRMSIIRRLVEKVRHTGIKDEQLYIDPLVTAIATDNRSGTVALETIRLVRKEFSQVHITCGLSNISYGQPARSLINQAFAPLAMAAGLDCAFIDPLDSRLYQMILATEMILGRDPDCQNYNKSQRINRIQKFRRVPKSADFKIAEAFRELARALEQAGFFEEEVTAFSEKIDTRADESASPAQLKDLMDALINMEKDRVQILTEALLEARADPMDLLMASRQAMVEVGSRFENGTYFIPELILAGRMLKDVAKRIKPLMQKAVDKGESRGRVLIGTVEGDIHDIGKDIVSTLIEANGYEVMDLGVNVPITRFVEAAKDFKPGVVGLSGFLTLAYDSMKATIAAIRKEVPGNIKFMLGGGQVDEQIRVYAEADGYGKDAVEAVNLCNQWIG